MIKGVFKFVFGAIAAVVLMAIIFVVSLVIGHAVTGSWDIREWGKKDTETSAVVTEYQPECNTVSSENYILNI